MRKIIIYLKCAQKPYALSRSISALCRSAASSGSSKFAFSPTLASLGANQVCWALCKCRTTFNHTAIYSILTRECLLFRFCSFFVLPDSDVVYPVDSLGSARIWGCSLCRWLVMSCCPDDSGRCVEARSDQRGDAAASPSWATSGTRLKTRFSSTFL